MVYMLITDPETNRSTVCAGAIINQLYIVTAAHCFCKNNLCEKVKDATGYNGFDHSIELFFIGNGFYVCKFMFQTLLYNVRNLVYLSLKYSFTMCIQSVLFIYVRK